MVNSDDPNVAVVEKKLQDLMDIDEFPLRLESALLIDAVQLFHQTISSYNFPPAYLKCGVPDNWEHGYTIINRMRTVRFRLFSLRDANTSVAGNNERLDGNCSFR